MQMLNDSSLADLSYETMWRDKLKQDYEIDEKKKKKYYMVKFNLNILKFTLNVRVLNIN